MMKKQKTPNTEHKAVNEIGLPESEKQLYLDYLNYAYKLAFLADGYMSQAEDVLYRNGKWQMEAKKKMKAAIKRLDELLEPVDKKMDDDGFFDDVKFLGKFLDTLRGCEISTDDEIKILSVIKNAYGKK